MANNSNSALDCYSLFMAAKQIMISLVFLAFKVRHLKAGWGLGSLCSMFDKCATVEFKVGTIAIMVVLLL